MKKKTKNRFFLSEPPITNFSGTLPAPGTCWNIFLFSLEIDVVGDINDHKRYAANKKKQKKPRQNRNFSQGAWPTAHGPEIFRVDAPYVAAHFPSRVVWGRNSTDGDMAPKRPSHAHFSEKLMHRCACAHNNGSTCICFRLNRNH